MTRISCCQCLSQRSASLSLLFVSTSLTFKRQQSSARSNMHLTRTPCLVPPAIHHSAAFVMQVHRKCLPIVRLSRHLANPSSEPRLSSRRYGPFFSSCPAMHSSPALHRFLAISSTTGLGSNDVSDVHADRRCKSQQHFPAQHFWPHTLPCCSALYKTCPTMTTTSRWLADVPQLCAGNFIWLRPGQPRDLQLWVQHGKHRRPALEQWLDHDGRHE